MPTSIFHKVVTKENAHSQLLCNLMKGDDRFCRSFLAFLLSVAPECDGEMGVRSQKHLPNRHGQPDLLIETPNWYVIVEVKTENHCARTKRQELDSPVKGYLSHLKTKKGARRRALIFLVPQGWKFRERLQSDIREKHRNKAILIGLKTWEEVVRTLPNDGKTNPFLHHFRLHLEQRFGSIKFEENEVDTLFAFDAPITTALKLTAFLQQLKDKFGTAAKGDMSLTNDEAGFYLKRGGRWLLFVGCWLTLWNEGYQYPICFGTEDDQVKKAFRDAFRKVFGAEAITFENWTLGWLTSEDLKNTDDVVEATYKKLEVVWRAVDKAANSQS